MHGKVRHHHFMYVYMYCWLRPVFWVRGLWPWGYGCHLSISCSLGPSAINYGSYWHSCDVLPEGRRRDVLPEGRRPEGIVTTVPITPIWSRGKARRLQLICCQFQEKY